jgi:hypothetical protein
MTRCKFTFDDCHVSRGIFNSVERLLARLHVERLRQRRRDQEEVLEQIIAQFERDGCDADTVDGFRSIEPMLNGLYSFGWGYTTEIVEETQ